MVETFPVAQHNSEYAQPEYWEKRFGSEVEREWFARYESFQSLVEAARTGRGDRVLVLGSGNSALPVELATLSGFSCVVATDVSPSVVRTMAARHRGVPSVQWVVADALALPFGDGSFDLVVEKGVLDCFAAGAPSPWRVPPGVASLFGAACDEAHRVLATGGAFLSISFSPPHFRGPLLAAGKRRWRVGVASFGTDWHYSFYTCRPSVAGDGGDKPQSWALPCEALPFSMMQDEEMDGDAWMRRVGDAGD